MDRGWATSMLRQAAEWARIEPAHFISSVIKGLEIGAARYGDHDYKGRDNAEGGIFEARDLAAYSLMEYADMDDDLAQGADPDRVQSARMYLGQAMRAACEADMMLRLARKERDTARMGRGFKALRRQTKGVAP